MSLPLQFRCSQCTISRTLSCEQMFAPSAPVTPQTLLDAGRGLTGLELQARQLVDGFLAGGHRGPKHGSSAEFAEHRPYAPGDDLRYLDWKVFGKRDRYYLRQLEQETNFVCHVLLDVSPSMRYRSEHAPCSKIDAGCLAAAALAWLVLRQQDLVGVMAFSDTCRTLVPPSGQPSHLKQIVEALERLSAESAAAATDLAALSPSAPPRPHPLHEWAEQDSRRGVVVVISDFLGDLDALRAALRHLRSRRHDVLLLHIVDPAEQDFPFDEPTLFHDVEGGPAQPVDCRQVRLAYLAEFDRFRRRLEAEARELGLDYALLRTDAPLDRALAAFLVRRARRGG